MEWKKDINENVRSGILKLLILQLLSEKEMYGYEIRKALAQRTNNAFEMKEASLYGPLYRMSSRGLISSRKEVVNGKRFRVYYRIEDFGRQYLAYGIEQIRYVFSGVINLLDGKDEPCEEENINES